jgi:hypothetical protein
LSVDRLLSERQPSARAARVQHHGGRRGKFVQRSLRRATGAEPARKFALTEIGDAAVRGNRLWLVGRDRPVKEGRDEKKDKPRNYAEAAEAKFRTC